MPLFWLKESLNHSLLQVHLAYLIICFWLEDNISSPVGYSYLSIWPDDKVDIFAASLLISHCGFSSLTSSSIVMILLYIYFKRFFLIFKGLCDGKVVSLTKKEYDSKVNIWWMV